MAEDEHRDQALQEHRKKLLQQKETLAKAKTLREQVKQAKVEYDKTEDDLKALQSVGQIIGEVLRQLDEERCMALVNCSTGSLHMRGALAICLKLQPSNEVPELLTEQSCCFADFLLASAVIVKASSGPRYVVGCRGKVDNSKLTAGTRVALDMTTLTIMRALPREVGQTIRHTSATESLRARITSVWEPAAHLQGIQQLLH